MENKNKNSEHERNITNKIEDEKIPDSLLYPPSEDIYNKLEKEADISPDDITKMKVPVDESITGLNEKSFEDDMSGADLDVPGSELDDAQERIGNEDEENNYYSIGGDNHNDLEESRDEI